MSEDDIRALTSLTVKQCEVLDRLLEHKSSKEIARELGISHHTVDQRLQFAKGKLGVVTRNECALEYRRLLQLSRDRTQEVANVSHPSLHEKSRSALQVISVDFAAERDGKDLIALEPQVRGRHDESVCKGDEYRVLPKMFDGPYGTFTRVGMIVLIVVLLLLIALGGVAFFGFLSQRFGG
jgi:DNA-binding CsgD family transcriptional regulator